MAGRFLLVGALLCFFSSQAFGASASYILDQHWVTLSKNGQRSPTIGRLYVEGARPLFGFELSYSLLGTHGGKSPTADIGDGQVLSNIDAEGIETLTVYELFASKQMGFVKLSVGWQDLSRLYSVSDPARLFVSSSFTTTASWGNTGFIGPSIFPHVSFGLNAWMNLSQNLYWGVAVMDPLTPENFYPKQMQTHILLNEGNHMAVTEVGYENPEKFHIALGAWNMEQAERALRPRFQQSGVWGQLDFSLNRLQPFLRWEQASRGLGLIKENRVAGLKMNKVFAKSRLDELAVGYSGALYNNSNVMEEIYELIYRYHFTPRLSLALSNQWVINPVLSDQDGQLMTLRVQVTSGRP